MNTPHQGMSAAKWDTPTGTQDLLVVLGQSDPDQMGFELGPARLSLGAGEADDVYLADVGVVPGHLAMIYLDGRITLLSAVETVWVNGQPVDGFPFDWPAKSVLSLGPDSHLAYGARGSDWPDMPVLDVVTASTAPTAESPSAGAQDVVPASRVDYDTLQFDLPALSPRARAIYSARLLVWATAAATVIVLLLVFADLNWGTREVIHPADLAIDRSEVALTRLLDSDPINYRSVQLTERPDGALALTGFIESESAYALLSEQAREEDAKTAGNVRLDALTPGRMLTLVADQLAGYAMIARLHVEADYVQLTVSGVAMKPDEENAIRERLARLSKRVAPRELRLDMQLQAADEVKAEIEQALSLGPTTRELMVEIKSDGAHISGLVASSVAKQTRSDLDAIRSSFELRLPIKIDIEVEQRINFSVASVTQGGAGSLATVVQYGNPKTVVQGEAVFGIANLLEIRGDGIALSMGRRQIFLPLIQ